MKKHDWITFILIIAVFLVTGCANHSEIHQARTQASSKVADRFEKIGLEQVITVEPIEGEFSYKIEEQPFTGTIYILANKDQIEHTIEKEELFINGEELDTVVEGSEDDFNIRENGRTYFSIKKLEVEHISELEVQTSYESNFIICLAREE